MTPSSLRTLLASAALPAAAVITVVVASCTGSASRDTAQRATTLALGAYTTPREVYGQDILPAFTNHWRVKTGGEVTFEESYLGSGAQARAIAGGFEADVAALSLEGDIETLVKAGLVKPAWRSDAAGGMVSRSLVVLAVRPGNPKKIADWADLARPGLKVLTPNPRTSGGAMWNIAALYGAAFRGHTGVAVGDSAAAEALLAKVLANVEIMDKGARESILTFENGIGDVAITYENEVITARASGKQMDMVIPPSTILIENPVAVVDTYVDKRGTRLVAEEFVRFLSTPETQRMFAKHGFRPVDERVAREYAANFPPVTHLFTIRDLGGWSTVAASLFGEQGAYARASDLAAAR